MLLLCSELASSFFFFFFWQRIKLKILSCCDLGNVILLPWLFPHSVSHMAPLAPQQPHQLLAAPWISCCAPASRSCVCCPQPGVLCFQMPAWLRFSIPLGFCFYFHSSYSSSWTTVSSCSLFLTILFICNHWQLKFSVLTKPMWL